VIWPASADELVREQRRLAAATPPPWEPSPGRYATGGCFLCFPRGQSGYGEAGDPSWVGAVVVTPEGGLVTALAAGRAAAPYEAGLLALREGPQLEAAVRGLPFPPAVLLVNATGRDHPRRAGLALHLGALLSLPSVGVTHRPLVATGDWPGPERGARSPLVIDGEPVGCWLRTREGTRPLAIHAGWRTDPEIAAAVALAAATARGRTPEPLRQARRVARTARAAAARGDLSPGW
jgi:deoxyribonuclease V